MKNSQLNETSDRQSGKKRTGRVSITIALTTAIGLLVLITVSSVMGVGVWLAQKNTFSLLSDNVNQRINFTVGRLKQHLRPAQYQLKYIAERIAQGDIEPAEKTSFTNLLTGALAAAPQISGVVFIDTKLKSLTVARHGKEIIKKVADHSDEEPISAKIATPLTGAYWGAPVWREDAKAAFLNFTYPIYHHGEYLGVLIAAVSARQLSEFTISGKRNQQGNQFILYGHDHVLAHRLLTQEYPNRSVENPLPKVVEFEDSILASIWQKSNRSHVGVVLEQGTNGHTLEVKGERYVFIYKELHDFGSKPLIIGKYFLQEDASEEVARMFFALIVGIVMLLIALVAAIIVGRKIARPIVQFSSAAGQIRDLEISRVEGLQGSVFSELDNQAASFNAMLRALKWFELYVPKKIVEHLIKSGDVGAVVSDARNVTVMFTDIVGFSSLSENLSAQEVAAFVNEHFRLVGECISAENGTVDKFIGDSVMAYWGAPEALENTAEPACRAALAISKAVCADNQRRKEAGKQPIRMRIGIHTGGVTVGNIGAQGRINYTIIGDTVNIGQRLEQLGKQLGTPNSDVSILISGETARALGTDFNLETTGGHQLKGREAETEVFKLT